TPISDPVLVFALIVTVILVAPLLAERIGVPDLVLLLIAGTILGPNVTGLLENEGAIKLLGSVGLLYIMFIAGLDIDLYRFSQTRTRSIGFGLLTFLVPQIFGTFLGRFLLGFSWPASVLMASLFASHTLLAYPIVSRLGIVKHEAVSITVGATIITDILALMVLGVVADMARNVELGLNFWATFLLGILALVWLATAAIPLVSRWFFRRVPEKGGAQFLFVLAVVCAFAYLSHFAKMEPIIGAFLAGVAFNRLIPEKSILMNRVQFTGHTLFIPFFLLSVGMLVDPRSLIANPKAWVVALTMIAGVVATKYIAAKLAGKLFGYTKESSNVMFGLSVVQAAATLAAVLVGYELDIFDETVLNGAIAMILVTCPLGAWMVDRFGREIAATEAGKTQKTRLHGRRTQNMLVPVFNPSSAINLLDLAFILRDESFPGEVQPLAIAYEGENIDREVAAGERLLAKCMSHAAAADRKVNAGLRLAINVGDGVVRAARELRSDVVVMGLGAGRKALPSIFGDVRDTILEECPARIIACRLSGPINTTKRVLLPLPPMADRCSDLEGMLGEAKLLSKQIGAVLHVFLVKSGVEKKLKGAVEKAMPKTKTIFTEMSDWRSLVNHLNSIIAGDDFAFLPTGRKHGSFWMPGLEKLPETLASKFPKLNLVTVYPSIEAEELVETDSEENKGTGRVMNIVHAGKPVPTDSLDHMLDSLVGGAMPELSAQQNSEARSILSRSAMSFPVEMAPGIVIIHGHADLVIKPTLMVALCTKPISFKTIELPARIVMALISPAEGSGNSHLKALAELAFSLQDKDVLAKIQNATSSEQIKNLLLK
ncbi:MAG: cation:proton antiporter, partial [Victivallales bacterium]|nr:cation:proton antiporter [Victivallales bacterium]